MSETTIEQVPTSQLRVGDVVLNHGMRIEVVTPVQMTGASEWAQRVTPDSDRALFPVFFTRGVVLNGDAAAERHGVPRSWMRADAPEGHEYGWLIQGNDRAVWSVERGVYREGERA